MGGKRISVWVVWMLMVGCFVEAMQDPTEKPRKHSSTHLLFVGPKRVPSTRTAIQKKEKESGEWVQLLRELNEFRMKHVKSSLPYYPDMGGLEDESWRFLPWEEDQSKMNLTPGTDEGSPELSLLTCKNGGSDMVIPPGPHWKRAEDNLYARLRKMFHINEDGDISQEEIPLFPVKAPGHVKSPTILVDSVQHLQPHGQDGSSGGHSYNVHIISKASGESKTVSKASKGKGEKNRGVSSKPLTISREPMRRKVFQANQASLRKLLGRRKRTLSHGGLESSGEWKGSSHPLEVLDGLNLPLATKQLLRLTYLEDLCRP